ncbi:IclR family transcriptional regulator [Conexibacter sp. JD483]|uniref:IclR family transcriptional regulator n=1 Tax=unclassified Conexibacter TaxID=2627773 RepID=UPI0027204D29|nr:MULTISPECIES: IclR family transcriptional regulator [unclassified Conexibacter]MDO8187299.1 IclR family transcriptional regulator [Conexibacter sp. CPCC 205706]MDO8198908.1 IclR family transcriptional regulator [Conexibacter sp. CPCC 205762]MDR9370647.1 IclR family transcriptional regulator [Conexibacter sp. JD483]
MIAEGSGTSTSVVRAFDVLERIALAGEDGITLGQLAAMIPTAKSTTHRYVATLLRLGVLRRDERGHLRLGYKLVELAGTLLDGDDVRSAAAPILNTLAARTGETVHLGVVADDEVVYIAKIESPHSVRLVSRIGARVPFYCSAMGKAILANLDGEPLERALAIPRAARTERTIVERAALLAEVDRVRAVGVALDDEENEIGVRCIGAAVVVGHEPVAAISVSAPEVRMSHERCTELTPHMIAAAAEISRRLGRARMHAPASTHTR